MQGSTRMRGSPYCAGSSAAPNRARSRSHASRSSAAFASSCGIASAVRASLPSSDDVSSRMPLSAPPVRASASPRSRSQSSSESSLPRLAG